MIAFVPKSGKKFEIWGPDPWTVSTLGLEADL